VAPIAGDDAYFGIFGLEDRVSEIALHIVSRLVEVPVARDVVLPLFTEDTTIRVDNHRRVPENVAVGGVALQDGRDDDDAVLTGELRHEARRRAVYCILRELCPRIFFPRAKAHWHSCVQNFIQNSFIMKV
jgi:hypothetical protein